MVQSGKRTIRRPDEIKSAGHEGLWAVVVGEGQDRRFGSRTRLRETLERIGRVIPPERTLVVRLPGHARDQASQVGPHVLDEPDDRGTGAAVLLAALWIEAREPRATVVFLPSDRVIVEEGVLMARVAEMADFVERQPGWMILLGVSPHGSDMEHGWIEPGQRVGWVAPVPSTASDDFMIDPRSRRGSWPAGVSGTPWSGRLVPVWCSQRAVNARRASTSIWSNFQPSGRLSTSGGRCTMRTPSPRRWTFREPFWRRAHYHLRS
jgi:hypothetical protein